MFLLRKVYGILTLQVLFTCAMCAVFMLVLPVRNWTIRNSWMMWVMFALTIITIFPMTHWRREYPRNIVCLSKCPSLFLPHCWEPASLHRISPHRWAIVYISLMLNCRSFHRVSDVHCRACVRYLCGSGQCRHWSVGRQHVPLAPLYSYDTKVVCLQCFLPGVSRVSYS